MVETQQKEKKFIFVVDYDCDLVVSYLSAAIESNAKQNVFSH